MATFRKNSSGEWRAEPTSRVINPYPYIASVGIAMLAGIAILVVPALANNIPATPKPKPAPQAVIPPQPQQEAAPQPLPTKPKLISPKYGQIKLGAFSGEAAHLAGLTHISTVGLANPTAYAAYRTSVRNTYGVDLEDMNYFSLDSKNLETRLQALQSWIHLAGEYGDVTLALEPLGPNKYEVFEDKVTMLKLATIFTSAKKKNITIWVRFASESNLRLSEYSAVNKPEKFYAAAKSFKSQMPDNVKLVFSPLINTYYQGKSSQQLLAKKMFFGPNSENKIWDCIGGTIYRTDLPLTKAYRSYYDYMSELAPKTPFQICEVGGPYSRREELLAFLKDCSQGEYPRLQKVNLFARNINKRADPNSEFGYLEPVKRATKSQQAISTKSPQLMDSFLKPILESAQPN